LFQASKHARLAKRTQLLICSGIGDNHHNISNVCYIFFLDSSSNAGMFAMSVRKKNQLAGALKHGAYSNITLLPGEDPIAFQKLYDDLVVEFTLQGPAEEDLGRTMAHILWRKQNVTIYNVAKKVNRRYSQILEKSQPPYFPLLGLDRHPDERTPEEIRAATEAAEKEAREELGESMVFVEIGEDITTQHMFEEFSVLDRLDSYFERCVKRLLLMRGAKSVSSLASTASKKSRKR
jgi:hypothetical protein